MREGRLRAPWGSQANLSKERPAERVLIKTPTEKTTNLPQWEKKDTELSSQWAVRDRHQMITLGVHMPKPGEAYNYRLGEAE